MRVFDLFERLFYATCASVSLFWVLYPIAYAERGYHAVGGEGMAAVAAFFYVAWKWES